MKGGRFSQGDAESAVYGALPCGPERIEFGAANSSLWHDSVRDLPRLPAPGGLPAQADVAIVGGGLTGLWTAYYLKSLRPELIVALFEANHIAFGASGRAGGWLIATLDGQGAWLEALPPAQVASALGCVAEALDEIERVTSAEGIACGLHRGGMVRIAARNAAQAKVLAKYRKMIAAEHGGRMAARMLDAAAAGAAASMAGAFGGVFYPHCAVVNPAKLAYGLARAAARKGVKIFENCGARSWDGATLRTDAGAVSAATLVPALEGYSGLFPETAGRIIPVFSHVIATEPLSPNLRGAIGLANRQAFADCSGISTYGQVTEDDRIVFGALASYPAGGRLDRLSVEWTRKQYRLAHATLVRLWPQLADTAITHAWSGALGVPRNFRPVIVEDRTRRLIWGGGYTSRGLTASHLFGRTIAEMICSHDTVRTRCPWVRRDASIGVELKAWEPEPFRWLAISSITAPARLQERALQSNLPPFLRNGMAGLAGMVSSDR